MSPKKPNNPLHSSTSSEFFTPPEIVEAAREVLGEIDCDPASCRAAQQIVKARHYFTKEDDGLNRKWSGRTMLNPPGGKVGNKSLAALWWMKLYEEWAAGRVPEAVFIGFQLGQLQTLQGLKNGNGVDVPGPLDFVVCVLGERVSFLAEQDGKLVALTAPTHGNFVAFLPPPRAREEAIRRFVAVFSRFGKIVRSIAPEAA
jgi:hypothetical protein